jgi:hypothetical protein
MSDSEPVNPEVKKWVRRFLAIKMLSIASMIACMAYMLLWKNSQTDVALIWLGLTFVFSFVGARWCRWHVNRAREES